MQWAKDIQQIGVPSFLFVSQSSKKVILFIEKMVDTS